MYCKNQIQDSGSYVNSFVNGERQNHRDLSVLLIIGYILGIPSCNNNVCKNEIFHGRLMLLDGKKKTFSGHKFRSFKHILQKLCILKSNTREDIIYKLALSYKKHRFFQTLTFDSSSSSSTLIIHRTLL
jgi:hypothetical protein